MAGAEARAVWQRTANRCFVQEDAKRAPKLACCQSSSSSSKQVDTGPTGVADVSDQPAARFKPPNMNHLYSELPSDTRWWLQLQPNYVYERGLTSEQINDMEAEIEALRTGVIDSPSKVTRDPPSVGTGGALVDSNENNEVAAGCLKKEPEVRKQNIEAVDCKTTKEILEVMDMGENYEFIEMDSVGCLSIKTSNELCFDTESAWIEGGKTVPWWRTTDKDDLASLVAQRSVSYMENCDLPPPQKKHTISYAYARPQHETLSLNSKSQTGHISKSVHAQGSPDFRRASAEEGQMPTGSSESFSNRSSTMPKGILETPQFSESNPCKAQLLEALRHSQTRAREAETAAKQAYAEKEHILKLFFRQASQLFAYKQWFQMLQLEALYLQIKNSDQPISTLFPGTLPWVPQKGRKMRKNYQKAAKGKRGKASRPKHDMSNYAIIFAWGLGLVGAGLLLGWTVGWMLPF